MPVLPLSLIFELIDRIVGFTAHVKAQHCFPNGATAHGPFQVIAPQNVYAEFGLHLNHGVFINGAGGVNLGKNVIISANAMILSASLDLQSYVSVASSIRHDYRKVVIGDSVWIGAGAIILPGVSIGPKSVVAAGSVVTRSVPGGVLVAGVPARVIREFK